MTETQWLPPMALIPKLGVPQLFKKRRYVSTVAVESNVDIWSQRSLPGWVHPFVEQMKSVHALKPGWDGPEARPVSSEAFRATLVILEETMARDTIAPTVVPVSDGGLQLEWHCAGVDLEVYIERDGQVSAWCREGSREWEEDFYSRSRLKKELSLLTEVYCR
jgi:hypothetical protein